MLSRLVKVQLVLFTVITVAALVVMSLFYVKIPQQLGHGRFEITVELDDAGGLYPRSAVTYRGSEVGLVTKLDTRYDGKGIVATLQIEDGADIPSDSTALVRSASVIGEQYVDFVPRDGATDDEVLKAGDVIATDDTVLPVTTEAVLSSADRLIQSIPTDALEIALNELGTAFDGVGDDLGSTVDAGAALVDEASANLPETISLIEGLEPVLDTQAELHPQLQAAVASLDSLTLQLDEGNDGLRTIFDPATHEPFLNEIGTFVRGVEEPLTNVLTDVSEVAPVANAYLPSLDHALGVAPALQAFINSLEVDRMDDENPALNLWFKLGFDSPACNIGFSDANNYPTYTSDEPIAIGPDNYCKVPSDSPLVVRGARNQICPNDPALRGAYAADCGLVFDRPAVDKQERVRATPPSEQPALLGLDLVAPTGEFFLTDVAAKALGGYTWQDLLAPPGGGS